MSLTPAQRARYARHTLLPEIGLSGQEKLCAARVRVAARADSHAARVTRDYLQRAGVTVASDAATEADTVVIALAAPHVDQLASHEMRHAAAMFAGAFTAVETIKGLVGAGSLAQLPASIHLGSEES